MLKLNVKITFPDGKRSYCGEIFTTTPDSNNKIEGSFRYMRSYLDSPRAFSLDPENLPLGPQEFFTQRPEGVHGVFEDALPDDWGRALLAQKEKISRSDQAIPKLLEAIGSNGLGALCFETKKKIPHGESPASIYDLEALVETALKYDAGLPVDNESLLKLFSCGSSPGGARPKVLIQKKSGSLWLAKFPKANDSFHIEPIEAGTLEMAQNAGLSVPEFEIQKVGDKKILLVKRFDVTDQGGRYHMISMKTLLNAEGYYHLSYSDLFNSIQKYSFQPAGDNDLLFRQMIFNMAIGNTDDHLKNFCMLHKESGLCLSPVYDVLPDIYQRREHQLSFSQAFGSLPVNHDILQKIGNNYKVSKVNQIIDDVFHAVSDWRSVYMKYEVPVFDIERLEWSIDRRLGLLNNHYCPKTGFR